MSFSEQEKKYFNFFRKKYFQGNSFNNKIIKSFEKENFELKKEKILSDTSYILKSFIALGKSNWDNIKEDIESNFINLTQDNFGEIRKDSPEIYKIFEEIYNQNAVIDEDIKTLHNNLHKKLSNTFSRFCFSNMQFAKNLAGKTFEHHIELLLKVCNYKFERQQSITKGQILDFVYPNIKRINDSPSDCIVSECQSTLKDRFRLSLGKIPLNKPIKKYIFTGSGIGVITKTDNNDITKDKVSEIRDKGWTVVVFDEVKQSKFSTDGAVISYEHFFNKVYPSLSGLWD